MLSSVLLEADFTANRATFVSQSPALCCGKKHCTKRSFVLLSVSTSPSMVNLVCRQEDFLLIPAVPAVKVRRILDALRKDWEPSIPIKEPLKLEAPKPRIVTKSLLISSLEKMKGVAEHIEKFKQQVNFQNK